MNLGTSILFDLVRILLGILLFFQWLVIIAAVITWVNPDPRNPIVQFLYRTTEPLLRPFRRILSPRRTGGIDFSPLLLILLIVLVRNAIARSVFGSTSIF